MTATPTTTADRAIAGRRAGDLGVTGIDATMAALEAGQVDELAAPWRSGASTGCG